MSDHNDFLGEIDGILLQSWFNLTADQIQDLIRRINARWPSAKIAYLDWFAPADLRYAASLNDHVAAYVKKQVLVDFSRYDSPTIGDTNLTDYYSRRFGIDLPVTRFQVPVSFPPKLHLGAGFEYSPQIIKSLVRKPRPNHRPIDVHARIATRGTEWYSRMRQEALDAAADLSQTFEVVYKGLVSRKQYLTELYSSKICFSPFGYGEVCWRDFEAMSCGALLVKPDMSHLKINNDPFRPFETYVPVAWDLSDLREKVSYYLAQDHERERIAQAAFENLHCHFKSSRFVDDSISLWTRMGLLGAAKPASAR